MKLAAVSAVGRRRRVGRCTLVSRASNTAAQSGVSSWKIRQQTGHASDAMLSRYLRDAELFTGNAAGALL